MTTILNHATCSCEDGKYVESVINNSVVMCDEILPPQKNCSSRNYFNKSRMYFNKMLHFTNLFIIYHSIIDSC